MSTPEDPRYPWYDVVDGRAPLAQGDIVFGFPVLRWREAPTAHVGTMSKKSVKGLVGAADANLVVMTQACDLQQGNVEEVQLCAHYAVSEYRPRWADTRTKKGKPANSKEWQKYFEGIRKGYIPRASLLEANRSGDELEMEVRIVAFDRTFSCPRWVIENYLRAIGRKRLRLCPPYREHLSQAFARFFMRVGLPNDIKV